MSILILQEMKGYDFSFDNPILYFKTKGRNKQYFFKSNSFNI